MTAHEDELKDLRTRADRLVAAPHEIGTRFTKLFGGLYRFFGWQAKFTTKHLQALLDSIGPTGDVEPKLLHAAMKEAEDNVELAERAVAIHKYVPTAHASWLARVLHTLERVDTLSSDDTREARRAIAGLDKTRVLPPLRIEPKPKSELEKKADEGLVKPIWEKPEQARLLELQLAAIDHIMEAARGETQLIDRRRRLLEGARRLLLDVSAALPLEETGVKQRERFLASEITKLDRLQGAGLDPGVGLLYQARRALRRGDRDRVYAALLALDSFALSVGDRENSTRTGAALDALHGTPGGFTGLSTDASHVEQSLERSAHELFGKRVVDSVGQLYASARNRYAQPLPKEDDPELRRLALEYLAPGSEREAVAALVSVDGCFEVGAAMSPVRSTELEEIARLVPHPTPEMLLVTARSVEDVPAAVFDDPRRILLDLAAGSLLSRKYVLRSQRPVERTRLVGEARVYLLDASTSMLSQGREMARARMRDAIMLAELATMLRRLEEPRRRVRLSLYYRFFTLKLGGLTRIRSTDECLAAMADIVGNARKGGTDIQTALLSSFELIRDAKKEDPDLARASIILVTDGEAPVDGELIRKAREEAGDVVINVSVIALGQENPVLRELVARQRARGERAFYHHVDDDRLLELCMGEVARLPVHGRFAEALSTDLLRKNLEDAIVELEDLDAVRRNPAEQQSEAAALGDGRKALEEAAVRDGRSLERRFTRWFPEPKAAADPKAAEAASLSAEWSEDLDAVKIVLTTVAEVVGELGGDMLQRRADAIEIVERLLQDSRLSPSRYHAFVASCSGLVHAEIAAVHTAVVREAAGFEAKLAEAQKRKGPGEKGR